MQQTDCGPHRATVAPIVMWRGATVAVVMPAYNEARLIERTLRGVPSFVDLVYVVDDASRDTTAERAAAVGDTRVRVIRHRENRGVGAAIVTGCYRALDDQADLVAVMAGDDQMHPADLEPLLEAVAGSGADYGKGNRFAHPHSHQMPWLRRTAGAALSSATRLATGLRVTDTQCGYTVITARAARRLPLDSLWPRYGYPNDLLALLAAHGCRVVEVPVRPVYADERSGIRPWHALVILAILARRAAGGGAQASSARSMIVSAYRRARSRSKQCSSSPADSRCATSGSAPSRSRNTPSPAKARIALR